MGTYHQKVDGKGRVSIPSKLRRVMETGDEEWDPEKGCTTILVFGSHLDNHVEGYSVREFEALTARIMNMKQSNPMRDRLQRMFLGKSVPLVVDKAGRTILPREIRDKLGIDETGANLRYVGLGDRFEIWIDTDYEESVEVDDEAWLAQQGDDFKLLAALDEE